MDTHSRHESFAATAIAAGTPAATVRLVRSADQRDVVIELFDVTMSDSSVLIAGPNPMLRLTFGPQHVAEEAFLASETVPTVVIGHIGAASSVVVPLTTDFDFTVDAILDLAKATTGLQDGTGFRQRCALPGLPLKEQLRMIFQAELLEARALLSGWISWAQRCPIPAFARLAKTIKRFQVLILNAVEHGLSNARSEATNTHLRLLTPRAYGYHSPESLIAMADLTRGGFCPPLPGQS